MYKTVILLFKTCVTRCHVTKEVLHIRNQKLNHSLNDGKTVRVFVTDRIICAWEKAVCATHSKANFWDGDQINTLRTGGVI